MIRTSNINWTAFLFTHTRISGYSSFGAGVWTYSKRKGDSLKVLLWIAAALAWIAFGGTEIIPIPFWVLIPYILFMSTRSILAAVEGNSLQLQYIKKQGMTPEEELEERMLVVAWQEIFFERGILLMLSACVLFSVVPLIIFWRWQNLYFLDLLFQVPITFVMLMTANAMAALITLLIACLRGNKENVLYSGKIPKEIMIKAIRETKATKK